MTAEFMCDAIDDVRDYEAEQLDETSEQPTFADPLVVFDCTLRLAGIDPVKLAFVNPIGYLWLGTAFLQGMAQGHRFYEAKRETETRPYVAVEAARRTLHRQAHQLGLPLF